MINELTTSIKEVIKQRTVSGALGSFLFFLSAIHWEGWYVTFFTSESFISEKFGMLKNEYVHTYFFGWHGWRTFFELIGALAFTYFFVFILPRFVLIHFFREEQRYKINKRKVKLEEEAKLEMVEEDVAKQEKKTLIAQSKVAEEKKRIEGSSPEVIWSREFLEIAESSIFPQFSALADSIYKHNGTVIKYDNFDNVLFEIPRDILMYADSNELIVFTDSQKKISLTQKGKYFMKEFLEYNNVLAKSEG